MREIKFRALVQYEGLGKVWEYYKTFSTPMWIEPNVSKIIVQDLQYTEVKDKNNKEIYEGDILESRGKPYYYVIFRKGCYYLRNDTKEVKWSKSFDGVFFSHYKVIGNIYENKNILV